jgi:hypothetical protein
VAIGPSKPATGERASKVQPLRKFRCFRMLVPSSFWVVGSYTTQNNDPDLCTTPSKCYRSHLSTGVLSKLVSGAWNFLLFLEDLQSLENRLALQKQSQPPSTHHAVYLPNKKFSNCRIMRISAFLPALFSQLLC